MTNTEKWKKILELGPAEVVMRRADISWGEKFYVSQAVEIQEGSMLRSVSGGGRDANAAVQAHFTALTEGRPTVVINAMTEKRSELRWNPLTESWMDANEPIFATHLITDDPQ